MSKLEEKFRFSIIIPNIKDVNLIDETNVLISISNDIFDEVIYRLDSGLWVYHDSLYKAKSSVEKMSKNRFSLKVLKLRSQNNFYYRSIGFLSLNLVKLIDRIKFRPIYFDTSSILPNDSVILYDLVKSKKKSNADILTFFDKSRKFSIYHGGSGTTFNKMDKNCDQPIKDKKLTVFIFSDKEREYYKNAFCINDNQFFMTKGVPKYDSYWLEKMERYYSKESKECFKKGEFVLLLSRPAESPLFTIEQREDSIRDIKKIIIDKLKLKIVIKLHPKEINNNIYEKILGSEDQGKNWSYSTQYHMTLAKKSKFVIVFYSGTVIDMVRIGVPSIEYLNFNILKENINKEACEMYSIYRNMGFTFGASNYEQLKVIATEININPQLAESKLKKNYLKCFPYSVKSPVSDVISAHIASNVF
jgi:hypothetical protein